MKTTVQQTSETDTWQAEAHKQASAATILQTYKDKTAQRYASDDDELLQGKFEVMTSSTEQQDTVQRNVNNTGLPDSLKNGIENLSGYSMDDVKVHYNSSQPATLQAHAYAQGTDIHIAPGQEKHLPHEAWHVVQQKQGRVKPTMQMKGNVPVNDNEGLEKEADSMGSRAVTQLVATNKFYASTISEMNNHTVMQLQETLEANIIRILNNRRIIISYEEAVHYATQLTSNPENTLIPIVGRHRALRINRVGIVSSVDFRPPSDASHMRVSAFNGPMAEEDSSMLTYGPRPLTGIIVSQDATISAASLADIPPRDNLGQVMGGSAAQLSGIQNSEWLHLIAHSLGGSDTPNNILAGPHSLNTAMIPFERLVRSYSRQGHFVDYHVTFFSDTIGYVSYVHHVEIRITMPSNDIKIWTLGVNPNRIGEFINGQVLAEIEDAIKN